MVHVDGGEGESGEWWEKLESLGLHVPVLTIESGGRLHVAEWPLQLRTWLCSSVPFWSFTIRRRC